MDDDLGGLYFGGTELVESSGPSRNDDAYLQDDNGGSGYDHDDDFRWPSAPDSANNAEEPFKTSRKRKTNYARADGGVSAVSKAIQADYDSDDARIITLKQQGHNDAFVAEKLKEERRMIYKPKTIASRWLRLKRALQDVEDRKLDDESYDWYSHEDDFLLDCVSMAQAKFDEDVEAAKQEMFKVVAGNVADRLKKYKYTAKACRERYEGLEAGTALPPLDEDPDQEGRQKLREQRLAEIQRIREQEAEQKLAPQRASEQRLKEKQDQVRQKEKAREDVRKERSDAKAAKKRTRESFKAQAKEQRDARDGFLASERRKADNKKLEEQNVHLLYFHLTGRRMNGSQRRRQSRSESPEPEIISRKPSSRLASGYTADEEDEAEEGRAGYGSEPEGEESSLDLNDDTESSSSKSGSVEEIMPTRAAVTKETLLNPRSILTDAELEVLMFERNIARRGNRETHPQVVARLAEIDDKLSAADLDMLLGGDLPDTMTKQNKVLLLQVRDAQKSSAGTSGVTSESAAFKKTYEGYKGRFRAFLENRD